jgi:hypothetical protein
VLLPSGRERKNSLKFSLTNGWSFDIIYLYFEKRSIKKKISRPISALQWKIGVSPLTNKGVCPRM